MKVIFMPNGTKRNPYQQQLALALEEQSAKVFITRKFGIFPILFAFLRFGKPDILHLHWITGFFIARNPLLSRFKGFKFLCELWITKILGVKVVWTVHNLVNHEKNQSEIEIYVKRTAIRFYDKLIVHCPYAKEAVMETFSLPHFYQDKINIVYHGNYLNNYKNEVSSDRARIKLKAKASDTVFLFFGKIRPYKGVFQLIETFRNMDSPDIRLIIAGNPANEKLKRDLLKISKTDKRILPMLKYIPDDDIQFYMNAADVVVLPYEDILTSGSALLAMSFAKAVIMPDLGCASETLDKDGAFLYEPDEKSKGLYDAMKQSLSSDLTAMGNANYTKCTSDFSWKKVAKDTLKIYQSVWVNTKQ